MDTNAQLLSLSREVTELQVTCRSLGAHLDVQEHRHTLQRLEMTRQLEKHSLLIGELRGTINALQRQSEHPNHLDVQVQSVGIGSWLKNFSRVFTAK
jgi:CII-binding regulator of phage lambda lysogenization HflD